MYKLFFFFNDTLAYTKLKIFHYIIKVFWLNFCSGMVCKPLIRSSILGTHVLLDPTLKSFDNRKIIFFETTSWRSILQANSWRNWEPELEPIEKCMTFRNFRRKLSQPLLNIFRITFWFTPEDNKMCWKLNKWKYVFCYGHW